MQNLNPKLLKERKLKEQHNNILYFLRLFGIKPTKTILKEFEEVSEGITDYYFKRGWNDDQFKLF